MMGMMAGMFWGSILLVILLVGFAYVLWVLAVKESAWLKTAGQIIAIVMLIFAVLILLYGTIYGGMMGMGFYGGYGHNYMMGNGMMRGVPDQEMDEFMDKMMGDPKFRSKVEKYIEKKTK
ncbi:MAG: hypothetical protein KKH83_07790 [Candidatus Margulisbacteria bacterium]|nr:hypothetical protein [Candidatus Margulisiibacteriota bacterium]